MDSGYSYTEEPHPLARPREISGKTHYEYDYPETSVWLCEVREDGLEILPGKRWIGLGEHTFPVHELAKRLAPWQQNGLPPDEEIDKKLEELLRLNPALSETDVVTGSVLIADPVPPFKPWGGHMYSTNEK